VRDHNDGDGDVEATAATVERYRGGGCDVNNRGQIGGYEVFRSCGDVSMVQDKDSRDDLLVLDNPWHISQFKTIR
jgi:hypothetical protein